MSFNRHDRLRLIGFDSSFDPNIIGQCINQHYQSASIQPQNYCGATEFKLKGYPFHCSGMEAIKTRRLIVKVLVSIYRSVYLCLIFEMSIWEFITNSKKKSISNQT